MADVEDFRVPIPDPTLLTTQQLLRELAHVDARIRGVQEVFRVEMQASKEAVREQNRSSAEAIAKSEASTLKQLEGLNDKIDDLKERLLLIEGRTVGVAVAQRSEREGTVIHQGSNSLLIAIISLIVVFVIGAAGIIAAVVHR